MSSRYKSRPKRDPEPSKIKPYPFRSIEELLLAVREGRACNNHTHEALLVKLAPGTSTRCPHCSKNISAAPRWKCQEHGAVKIACSLCKDIITNEEASRVVIELQEQRVNHETS